ncbi:MULTISPECIES: signal peptidase I [Streptomyces]|uniref:Signal peptidase I n=1 Tax=Streptomyces lichenis TaxID=2306967 RepID=A0ABT0IKC9_9ACTN|nr:signal peptidase I [Streptomyces lichenis]MCK8681790.1 signal peptidase I [Streptomyces lichenis]
MSGKTVRADRGPGRLVSVLSGLAVALGCVLFLGGFAWGAVLYRPYTVPTDSMSPTVAPGDRVLAQRIDGTEVRRGDVVVFDDPNWGDLPMVKRVIGVGGDTVACCGADGRLTINGKPVDEPYLRAGEAASLTEFSAAVPEGRLFLLGDERNGSQDSRVHLQDASHGSVPRSAVTARVDAVAWPLGSMVERPREFAALPGGISEPGPVKPMVAAVAVGAVLVLAGAAGPSLARALSGGGRGADRKRPARGKAPADA